MAHENIKQSILIFILSAILNLIKILIINFTQLFQANLIML
jgi:hypothetical protein